MTSFCPTCSFQSWKFWNHYFPLINSVLHIQVIVKLSDLYFLNMFRNHPLSWLLLSLPMIRMMPFLLSFTFILLTFLHSSYFDYSLKFFPMILTVFFFKHEHVVSSSFLKCFITFWYVENKIQSPSITINCPDHLVTHIWHLCHFLEPPLKNRQLFFS